MIMTDYDNNNTDYWVRMRQSARDEEQREYLASFVVLWLLGFVCGALLF